MLMNRHKFITNLFIKNTLIPLLLLPLLGISQIKDYTFDRLIEYSLLDAESDMNCNILLNSKDPSYVYAEIETKGVTFGFFNKGEERIQGRIDLEGKYTMTRVPALELSLDQNKYTITSIGEKKGTVNKFGSELNYHEAAINNEKLVLYIKPNEMNLSPYIEKNPHLFVFIEFGQATPSGMLYEVTAKNNDSKDQDLLSFKNIKNINKTIALDFERLKSEHQEYLNILKEERLEEENATEYDTVVGTVDSVTSYESNYYQIDYNKSVIENFLKAEDNRKIDNISTFYANTVARYWDVYNPTHKQITDSYEKVWKSITYSKNEVLEMNNIDDAGKIWDVSINFKFKTAKKPEVQSKKTKVRIELNDDSEIVKIFGINADE